MRRATLLIMLGLLLATAILRLYAITRVPLGFTVEEVREILIARTIQQGNIASFYNVGDPGGGHEGLFPMLLAAVTFFLGDGLLNQRFLSACLGIISVALAYAFTRRLFGKYAGLVAAATCCIVLYPTLISRMALREALLLPFAFAFYWALASAFHIRQDMRPDPPNSLSFAALGLFIAALIYTHWTGLYALLMLPVLLLALVVTRQPLARSTRNTVFFSITIVLILLIPYIVLTFRSYEYSGIATIWENRPRTATELFYSTFRTTSSLFLQGDSSPLRNFQELSFAGTLLLVTALIGFASIAMRARQPRYILVLLGVIFGLLPGALHRNAPNFSYIILAFPALFAIGGHGTQVLAETAFARRPLTSVRVMGLSLLFTIISLAFVVDRLFNGWANEDKQGLVYTEMGALANYVDRTNDTLTTTICAYNLTSEQPFTIPDHVLFQMMLHRPHENLRFSDCIDGLILTQGGARQRVAMLDPRGLRAVADVIRPWMQPFIPITARGIISNTLIEVDQAQHIADQFGLLTQARVDWSPDTVGPTDKARLPVRMGGNLTFEGYQVTGAQPDGTFRAGDQLTLLTFWRADGRQVPGLRFFAHLSRNLDSEPPLQNDIISVYADNLRARDVFIQVIRLPLPPDFVPGVYYLSLGAYDNDSTDRLPIYDQDTLRGDRLILTQIGITSGTQP